MLDEKTLAMLGDRAAQEKLTERGELVSCPSCGADQAMVQYCMHDFWIECANCGMMSGFHSSQKIAIVHWNTRAPILTPEQIKRLK